MVAPAIMDAPRFPARLPAPAPAAPVLLLKPPVDPLVLTRENGAKAPAGLAKESKRPAVVKAANMVGEVAVSIVSDLPPEHPSL